MIDNIKNQNDRNNGLELDYVTFDEAIKLFPAAHSFQFVNVYGIVESYNQKDCILNLYDETKTNFIISVCNIKRTFFDEDSSVSTNDDIIVTFKIGDIIRIINLALCRDFTIRCVRIQDCFIFDSSLESYNPFSVGTQEHLSKEFERERIQQLQSCLIEKLLSNRITKTDCGFFSVDTIDIAFELLHMIVNDDSLSLVGWNGNCPEQKSFNLEALEEIAYTVSHRPFSDILLDENMLVSMYKDEELINITVYGDYHELVETIRPFDYLICFRVVCKPSCDEFERYCYSATISPESLSYIRSVEKKSFIGLEITKKLREYIKQEASQLMNDSQNITNQLEESRKSDILNRQLHFIKNCNHSWNTDQTKDFLTKFFQHKHDIQSNDGDSFIRIDSLSRLETNEYTNRFVVRAKFAAFLNLIPNVAGCKTRTVFDNMDELRKYGTVVHCDHCSFECSFIELENQDIDHENADFICPSCETKDRCNLMISLKIMIEDSSQNSCFVHFCGSRANSMFGIESITQLYDDTSNIPSNLGLLFRFLTHISKEGPCRSDIDFKLTKFKNKDEVFFQIQDFDLILTE